MSHSEQVGIVILNEEINPIYYDFKNKVFWVEHAYTGPLEFDADIPDCYYPKDEVETYSEEMYIEFAHTFNALGLVILDEVIITILPKDAFTGIIRILNKKLICDPIVSEYNMYCDYNE